MNPKRHPYLPYLAICIVVVSSCDNAVPAVVGPNGLSRSAPQTGQAAIRVTTTVRNTRTARFSAADEIVLDLEALPDGVRLSLRGSEPGESAPDLRPGRRFRTPEQSINSATMRRGAGFKLFDGSGREVGIARPPNGDIPSRFRRPPGQISPGDPRRGFSHQLNQAERDLEQIRAIADTEHASDGRITFTHQDGGDRQEWTYDEAVAAITSSVVYRGGMKLNEYTYTYRVTGTESTLIHIESVWFDKSGNVKRAVATALTR